jgi:hypothetical protein
MLLFRVLQLWPHDEMWAIEPDGVCRWNSASSATRSPTTWGSPSRDRTMPRFEVYVTARVLSAADVREHLPVHGSKSTSEVIRASLEYLSGVRQAIEADARVSDPETQQPIPMDAGSPTPSRSEAGAALS